MVDEKKKIKKILGIRKKGVVSEMYMKGEIDDKTMEEYISALNKFKESTGGSLDDWLKLPKSCSMYSADRSKCKLFYIN